MPPAFLLLSILIMLLFQKPTAPPPPPPPPTGFPFTSETLNYSVNWPSGLSLGEAHLHAGKSDKGWQFDFSVDASVPGFAVTDHYYSTANADLCSLELEKQVSHGSHSGHEKTVFDYKAGTATRTTLVEAGGHTDIDISSCAHDGLDYIFYARKELAAGRVLPSQDVLFGASYSVKFDYVGQQEITVNEKKKQADRVMISLKGPSSDVSVEVFFDRDPARTPLLVKVPFSAGTFSMELVR